MTKLTVSLSPHEKGPFSVNGIMWGVVIALLPAFIASIYYYGLRAIVVTAVAAVTCILVEFFVQKFMLKERVTAFDGSAAVTGILLAFNLPSSIPIWQVIIGSIVAIGVGKMAFGGLGRNPFNPALVGRGFMIMSFPVDMTTWPVPLKTAWMWNADAITAATPLGVLKEGLKKGESMADLAQQLPGYLDVFLGNIGGCIGEVSALAVLLGGLYMIFKKIITWHIPVFYLGTIFVVTGLFWLTDTAHYADPVFHILTGGVMLGGFFMMTDMVTSPMSKKGQIIFAVGAGLICSFIRLFGAYPEGCMFSILIMNSFVPLIDKYVKPKRFGTEVNYG